LGRDATIAAPYDVGMSETSAAPLDEAVARVGDRWTLLIVQALLAGSRRFNDLLEALPGIAPNVLSQRLKHLEREVGVGSRPYSR
jgi:DNA-binding HxlR family transcriptional regulator